MAQENYWWFSVRYRSDDPMQVERFETEEQAELYAVMADGYVVAPHTANDTLYDDTLYDDILYDYYLAFSERTE